MSPKLNFHKKNVMKTNILLKVKFLLIYKYHWNLKVTQYEKLL